MVHLTQNYVKLKHKIVADKRLYLCLLYTILSNNTRYYLTKLSFILTNSTIYSLLKHRKRKNNHQLIYDHLYTRQHRPQHAQHRRRPHPTTSLPRHPHSPSSLSRNPKTRRMGSNLTSRTQTLPPRTKHQYRYCAAQCSIR